jgi:hypothetical protein
MVPLRTQRNIQDKGQMRKENSSINNQLINRHSLTVNQSINRPKNFQPFDDVAQIQTWSEKFSANTVIPFRR